MVIRESHIDGAFKGWEGRGVYRLVDGSCWEQVHYKYQYQYMYRPEAKIIDDRGYFLEVDGMDERVEVRKVRCQDKA